MNLEENVFAMNEKPGMEVYNIIIPLFGILITFVNLFVVVSSGIIIKKDLEPRTTYMFLGNIGLCDMVTGIAVIFGHYSPPILKAELVCAFGVGLILSPTLASIYSVMLIAIDRYLYILYGLKYQIFMYPGRARFLILSAWALALITGFLPTLGWDMGGIKNEECWLILMAPRGLVIFINLIGLIPVFVVVVLYSIILYRALKTVNEINRENNVSNISIHSDMKFFKDGKIGNGNDSNFQKTSREPSKWKAILIVMFTTGSFVVTWVPYFILSAIIGECPLYSPLAILGFANSLLNPIIYAWWHSGFRTNSLKHFKCSSWCQSSCCKRSNLMISTNM